MKKKQLVTFLKGKKVALRPIYKKTDLESCLKWINDLEVTRYLFIDPPVTRQQEEKWFDDLAVRETDKVFAIETLDGKFIGTVGLHHINWKSRNAITGIIIGEKNYWNQGYGTDAEMLILYFAFNILNLRKVCSSVYSSNPRSLRCHQNCGFEIEGTKRQQIFKNGTYQDEIILGVFRDEWEKIWRQYQENNKITT